MKGEKKTTSIRYILFSYEENMLKQSQANWLTVSAIGELFN